MHNYIALDIITLSVYFFYCEVDMFASNSSKNSVCEPIGNMLRIHRIPWTTDLKPLPYSTVLYPVFV